LNFELIIIFVLLLISFISAYYAIKFGLLLLSLEDDIEASLDDIDECYKTMSEILQKPIFFDSMEVRQCITEIRRCRSVVIKVANRLTSFGDNKQIGGMLKDDDTRQKENNQITG
jgi:hypothetical protein